MELPTELLEAPELIWLILKHTGTSLSWLFLRKRYTYKEIYAKRFSGFLGLFFFIVVILIVIITLNY